MRCNDVVVNVLQKNFFIPQGFTWREYYGIILLEGIIGMDTDIVGGFILFYLILLTPNN